MDELNLPTIIIALLSLGSLSLGVLTLTRGPRDISRWAFLFLTLLTAAWFPANYFGSVVTDAQSAEQLVRADFAIGLLALNAFLIFADSVGGNPIRQRLLLLLTTPVTLLMVVLLYTDFVFTYQVMTNGVEVVGGAASPVYELLAMGYPLIGIGLLGYKVWRSKGATRTRVQIVLLGAVVMVLLTLGANLLLPKIVLDLDVQNWAQRLSYLGFVCLSVASAYGLWRR